MPFTGAGADLKPVRNVANGLFDWDWDTTGNPTFTDDGTHAVLSLIKERRGQWWADATGQRGSLLYTIKNIFSRTTSEVVAYINQALQPLLDSGYLATLSVTAKRTGVSRIEANVTFTRPGQAPQTVRVPVSW